MYLRDRSIALPKGAAMMVKNLQVVSFDANWQEIYVGALRGDNFSAVCPNQIPNAADIEVSWNGVNSAPAADEENDPEIQGMSAMLTSAKWCALEDCTILVLGIT